MPIMAEKTWRAFPIYIYTSENGDRFILPGPREFGLMEENIRSVQRDIDTLVRKKDKERASKLQQVLDSLEDRLDMTRQATESLRDKSEKLDFELSCPTFSEYLSAEEDAKDWVVGEPRIDEGKFSLSVLANNVKLGSLSLNREQVGELEPMVAMKLWEEMKVKVRPNVERLPFLNLQSTKPSKAS